PGTSLDPANAARVRALLEKQLADGVIDQLILESHDVTFDDAHVLRFARTAPGRFAVTRGLSGNRNADMAHAAGADLQWVTGDGYTRLPQRMLNDLGVSGAGGQVFFLPDEGHWRALTAAEVDERLGGKPDES